MKSTKRMMGNLALFFLVGLLIVSCKGLNKEESSEEKTKAEVAQNLNKEKQPLEEASAKDADVESEADALHKLGAEAQQGKETEDPADDEEVASENEEEEVVDLNPVIPGAKDYMIGVERVDMNADGSATLVGTLSEFIEDFEEPNDYRIEDGVQKRFKISADATILYPLEEGLFERGAITLEEFAGHIHERVVRYDVGSLYYFAKIKAGEIVWLNERYLP